MTNKWKVQHEFDNEPTFVVNAENEDECVEFSAQMPWKLRHYAAKELANRLNLLDLGDVIR